MPKVLKPYTIIPSNLYIQRDADRQVRNIINDMGRPGYVLVSRQMGKTNLLLNAKRELESVEDVFVYVDLSNPFITAKECFENIIDTAIETNFERFAKLEEQIKERRNQFINSPPHKQHSNELRLLLKSIPGKLVIILDEIDALTKTNYSDQIFAQIRSIYFSRINFNELSRLTYLLSGVIEPTDIIKDPKISPFNIGQKIFLNDFSKEEYYIFLKQSELSLTETVAERIFYWTNGNPRMTWDVCSEVENRLKKQEIDIELIDKIINELYLTTNDKPPVDHIRELIKNDREIRNAIINIQSKSELSISDGLKSKLYLAGIINYEESIVRIKNNIIKKSINSDWIKSLELDEKGLFETALSLVDKGEYLEGIQIFEKFIQGAEFDEGQKGLCYYYMAYASYKTKEFEKAIDYFKEVDFDKEDDAKMYYRCKNLKGLTHYYLNQLDESLEEFKLVIDSGRKDEIYIRSLLNYGSIALKTEDDKHKDNSIKIFNDIISGVGFEKAKLKPNFIDELKSIAFFNLAQIQIGTKDFNSAKENLYSALNNPKENSKPTIILSLLEIEENHELKKQLISQIIDLVKSNAINPAESDPENPLDFTFKQLREVLLISYEIDADIFGQIKESINLLGDKPYSHHLYDLAIYAYSNKHFETGSRILNELYRDREVLELDKKTRYNTAKLLAFFNDQKKGLESSLEYLSYFEKERTDKIDDLDFEILSNLIFQYTSIQNYKEALKYVTLINSLVKEVDENLLINYLVIFHLELNLYIYTKNPKVIQRAKEVVDFANNPNFKHQRSNLLGDTGLEIIKQNAENIVNPKARQTAPLIVGKTYGRNEVIRVKYRDGTIKESKFKKVELDVKRGDCFILTE
jgi:hypothetical protein